MSVPDESRSPELNTVTPRVFIAATRQNDGKATISLGLLAALQRSYPRIGYIKPVGQRFVEVEERKTQCIVFVGNERAATLQF